MSDIRPFKTAPPVGSENSFKFIAYGDLGLRPDANNTAKYVTKDVKESGYELIFHNGDISYARGYVSKKELQNFIKMFLIVSFWIAIFLYSSLAVYYVYFCDITALQKTWGRR